MRLLKDDGILALVMPSFFMDTLHKNTRHIIDSESVVIDVIRLPDNIFEHAKVTVDIVFLRKTGHKIHDITKTTQYTQEGDSDNVNQFWINNPHRVLGSLKLKWVKAYNRFVAACETTDKDKLLAELENYRAEKEVLVNYQKVLNGAHHVETEKALMVSQDLQYIFSEIEEIQAKANSLNSSLIILREKFWKEVEKINQVVDA